MRLAAALLMGVVVVAGASCRPRETDRTEGATASALRLFEIARHEPSESEIAALFELEETPGGRARLLDAVAALRTVLQPHAIATTPMEDGTRTVVDVAAALPGGGSATYVVALKHTDGGSWRVSAFWGPGVGWPERTAPSAEGLSVSPPPR